MSRVFLIITFFYGLIPLNLQAGELKVAVAANFMTPLVKISEVFTKETGHKLVISSGATGKFYSQIREGAPFEVLLSADQDTPKKLVADNFAVADTQFTYAVGKLVLWSPKDKFVDGKGAVLKSESVTHIAMANPKLAPYGAAAKEFLKKAGLWKSLESKMVYGENIAQTHQFVSTGNAEVGFVAMSQIKNANGSHWLVPDSEHAPLKQDAILLKAGKNNPVAKKFFEFLKEKKTKEIIADFGYGF